MSLFKIFGKKSDDKETGLLEFELKNPVDCLCDFTYNFYWQHKGEKLDPAWKIPGKDLTFGEIVEHLKNGGNVKIIGNVGHRLCASMGSNLVYFGGKGEEIDVGDVYVDGDVDTRMGISMTRGNIYVKGKVSEPMGNILEVKSDVKEYRKFRSITDIATHGLNEDRPVGFRIVGNKIIIKDGTVKDTVGARMDVNIEIIINGNMDLSTGILMKRGIVRVNGNTGKNTGALLNGGLIIINGYTDDFTGIDMIKGEIIINGDAGKFMAANKKSGFILAKKGNPIPPTSKLPLEKSDQHLLIEQGLDPSNFHKYK
jgi:formylmethanofuran dehydrogenase subunit C